ncbi:MAG: RecQ family ATP-dependent DNA helicase [Lutibacter sp.]|nr:RecQ family ATP-dependent DNA helicase [Lutibacter sp.]MBP9602375.1 RecQ family ATP-dependent DNA helicase [Lutibacter sp.]
MQTPVDVLKKYWNYDQFRHPQEEIINTVLKGENAVALLPTGGGKSICYQIPALLMDGVCIVVSPLIALIQDQVENLKSRNIKAIALTSRLSEDEIVIAFDNLQFGDFKFLYLSPEKLQSNFIQDKIKQLNVSLIAVDEAHCISQWGHDFRPSYLKLPILREIHPNSPIIAVTATATESVLSQIQENLNIKNAVVFKKSFQRKNLQYNVIYCDDVFGKIIQIVKKINAVLIIYTKNRNQTKEISDFLNRNHFKSSFYHGGLSHTDKVIAFNNWMREDTPIMVATNAFGMGIDKANVRAVIHTNIPDTLENFIQEAGRAGRDGEKSYSVILSNEHIINSTIEKFEKSTPSIQFIKKVYQQLHQYYGIALGELPTRMFDFSLSEFCSIYEFNILTTYNALKTLERENIIVLDENYSKKSSIKIILSNNQLYSYIESNNKESKLLQHILRTYGGIFEHYIPINEFYLAKKLSYSKNEVISLLKNLHTKEILNYSYSNTSSKLLFLLNRDDDYSINMVSKSIQQQQGLKFNKLKSSIEYVKNNETCRAIQLLLYFNEKETNTCGICDVCQSKLKKKTPTSAISEKILALLQTEILSSKEFIQRLNFDENDILKCLKILLEKNKIAITSQNKFKLKS